MFHRRAFPLKNSNFHRRFDGCPPIPHRHYYRYELGAMRVPYPTGFGAMRIKSTRGVTADGLNEAQEAGDVLCGTTGATTVSVGQGLWSSAVVAGESQYTQGAVSACVFLSATFAHRAAEDDNKELDYWLIKATLAEAQGLTTTQHSEINDVLPLMNSTAKPIGDRLGGQIEELPSVSRKLAQLKRNRKVHSCSAVIVKPPEAIAVVIQGDNEEIYLFDSHPRPTIPGAMILGFASHEKLNESLAQLFPRTEDTPEWNVFEACCIADTSRPVPRDRDAKEAAGDLFQALVTSAGADAMEGEAFAELPPLMEPDISEEDLDFLFYGLHMRRTDAVNESYFTWFFDIHSDRFSS